MKGLVYNISYTAKSNVSTELGYDTPTTRESYTLQNYSSAYVFFDGQLNLTGELNYKDSFIGLKNSIIFSPVYQEHPNTKSPMAKWMSHNILVINEDWFQGNTRLFAPRWSNVNSASASFPSCANARLR